MNKLTIITFWVAAGLMAVSCDHDEPEFYSQEATGKTFIENGVMVDANTDFSHEMLAFALNKHEWKRVSIFYYEDEEHVSDKFSIPGGPQYIHKDGTVEYNTKDDAHIRQYILDGKQLTVTVTLPWWSNAYYFDEVYTVVSVDLRKHSGRIIMDRELSGSVDGLDFIPTHERSVWNYAD